MTQRFQKIYTTLELEEAHVVQVFMRRQGIVCWLMRSNGLSLDENAPLAETGYKLFVPDVRYPQAEKWFQETFRCPDPGPYTGPLEMAFGAEKNRNALNSPLQMDRTGTEVFLWQPPEGDLIGEDWKVVRPLCPSCHKQMEVGDQFCDACGVPLQATSGSKLPTCERCGHEMPPHASSCPTCGEFN